MIGLEYIVKLKNMEYKEIANYLGISPQTVSDWVNGKRRVPPKRAEQLSSYLGVDAKLIAKKIDEEDEYRIQYRLGKFINSSIIRDIVRSKKQYDFREGDENYMEAEQLTLDLNLSDVENYGTIKELENQINEERKEIKTETLDISISEPRVI